MNFKEGKKDCILSKSDKADIHLGEHNGFCHLQINGNNCFYFVVLYSIFEINIFPIHIVIYIDPIYS